MSGFMPAAQCALNQPSHAAITCPAQNITLCRGRDKKILRRRSASRHIFLLKTGLIFFLKFESSGYLQAPGGISRDSLSEERGLQIADKSDVIDMVEEVEGIEGHRQNVPLLFPTAQKEIARKTGIQVHVSGTFQAVTRNAGRAAISEAGAVNISPAGERIRLT
jgi:hypothetical protein